MNIARPASVLAIALALTSLAACGDDSGETGERTVTVLAAASLTETFTDLAGTFEKEHDGVKVKLVFDSSATLAQMAEQRAPGDVLATADHRTMAGADTAGGVTGTPEQFATNVVVLALPKTNPARIDSLDDLSQADVDFLTCVPTAPCGTAAQKLLKSNGITHDPASQEVDVKAVLQKVEQNEADAGLVYRTDATAAGDAVTSIAVPGADRDPNTYWVAKTSGSKQDDLAEEWIALLQGKVGQRVLQDAGFGSP